MRTPRADPRTPTRWLPEQAECTFCGSPCDLEDCDCAGCGAVVCAECEVGWPIGAHEKWMHLYVEEEYHLHEELR